MERPEDYNKNIEAVREVEFPALKDSVYVDHVGATLYARSQLEAVQRDLLGNLYGNPHSHNQTSTLSADTVDQARYRILRFFHTTPEQYTVIFTSGCTAALKLVGETFAFSKPGERSKGDNSTSRTSAAVAGASGGCFCYLQDNHTSVQGLREIVAAGQVYCLDEPDLLREDVGDKLLFSNSSASAEPDSSRALFAFPAQSNFSGHKYPLEWVGQVQRKEMPFQQKLDHGDWLVLLDAASYVSTSPLDLSDVTPDFVAISFYKIFGFPTGLGALLVRRGSEVSLEKRYFGGGAVEMSAATAPVQTLRADLAARFEDGTIPYLDIIALRHGFDALDRLGGGMAAISQHCYGLARVFHQQLRGLRHGNGQAMAEMYGDQGIGHSSSHGAAVAFNLQRSSSEYIGFAEVGKLAQAHGIQLRTGCFCNIGACQKYLGLTVEQIQENFKAGHVCGDNLDLINGRPTGAVRVSFGYMSTLRDVTRCLEAMASCFLEGVSSPPSFTFAPLPTPLTTQIPAVKKPGSGVDVSKTQAPNPSVVPVPIPTTVPDSRTASVLAQCSADQRLLTKICLYPVKSCAAFEVDSWELGPRGLLYDREWMVVSESGVALGLKREPKLCLLQPRILLDSCLLVLAFPGVPDLSLPLDSTDDVTTTDTSLCTKNKICGDRVDVVDCGQQAAEWLETALERPGCRLLRQAPQDTRTAKQKNPTLDGQASSLSLANESQFLLVSRASVESLQSKMAERQETEGAESNDNSSIPDIENMTARFRANFVVGGGNAFEEEEWQSVRVGRLDFKVQGQCTRCQMVCMDPRTGERSNEPLRTLAAWRGRKVPFGIYLSYTPDMEGAKTFLSVGDTVLV